MQRVGPVEFAVSDPQLACRRILDLVREGQGRHVHLANAYTIALADKSAAYRQVLATPAVNFPDGKPIGWVSRLRRQSPRLRQVRGPQLFLDVFDQGRSRGTRHYLLGSTPDVLARLEVRLGDLFPGVEIVGTESPHFRALSVSEHAEQDGRIRDSGADIVWVGLGTPKQDFEAMRLANSLPIVAIAIGAAFDFAAGTLREAPPWMTALGLEWSYRLLREPKRLWRRYLFGNARFLKAAIFAPTRLEQ
ncbi:WecB/TagA/CpsF family glycosyltransferase [Cryobacterium sp. TMB1-7]|uniref:WecB/TagA/CpsF family glycosyltransferase n=1 Tax=Cryobacterium sp. TMB1-7 TaxID=2555866 RepID=UPI003519E728